jgi:hypothetical protein
MARKFAMDNTNLVIEKLRSELLQLTKKLESSKDQLPMELGIPKILINIESELKNNPPDKK